MASFDLNQPAAECSEEFPILSTTPEDFPGKRKMDPVQLLSLSPPNSRLRLPHCVAENVPSGSDSLNLRLKAQVESEPSDSGVKRSTFVDNLAFRQAISQPNTSENNHEPPTAQKKPEKPTPYVYFLSNEHVVEELLSEYSKRFEDEVTQIPGFRPGEKHEYLPLARATSRDGSGIPVLKVLQRETLNRVKMPTLDHRIQQKKLLDWLFKQIFEPDHGSAVMGVDHVPYLNLGLNDPEMKIGAIQEKLINYFSTPSCEANHDYVGQIATDLIKSYEDQNPSE
ncbi:hypothetical protein PtA15_11A475 [Puccinia triticina]|uniref:Uncharacterized protein n=1 Tax=Puccinia triticina TaxID=208348 RepID=A0ABY7CYU5_9BASI|nr:uncharacterized protein PtA15_11A475 [Puccinia triticina]WAQ89784.1 hypothetical protein PtA15_11A475 [Puccinia triticina]